MSILNFAGQKINRSFSVFLIILFTVSFSYSQAQDNKIVNIFIASQAKKEKADEYRDARKILRGDVNNDGKEDLVVLYTLEGFGGGNLYIQYLAVFLGNGKNFLYANHKSAGGKNNRSIELSSVKNGTINLTTLEYLPNDPSCCPSKKGKAHFIFSKGVLKEIK
jgi:hypothetical protein